MMFRNIPGAFKSETIYLYIAFFFTKALNVYKSHKFKKTDRKTNTR